MGLSVCPAALFTQVEMYEEIKWLTAIVQYSESSTTDTMLTLRGLAVSVVDDNRSGVGDSKMVYLDVVRCGDEAESPIAIERVERLRGVGARASAACLPAQ